MGDESLAKEEANRKVSKEECSWSDQKYRIKNKGGRDTSRSRSIRIRR